MSDLNTLLDQKSNNAFVDSGKDYKKIKTENKMITQVELIQMEQAMNSWQESQVEEKQDKGQNLVVDPKNLNLPKEGIDYTEKLKEMKPADRKAFLTVLSFEEPQSFKKTAYAMYATEFSNQKDLNKVAARVEENDKRRRELDSDGSFARYTELNTRHKEFYIYFCCKHRKIKVDSRKWRNNGLFNSAGRARYMIKKRIHDIDDVRLTASWVENTGKTPILVFSILPKMDAPATHHPKELFEEVDEDGNIETVERHPTLLEIEERILGGEMHEDERDDVFTDWTDEDLKEHRKDCRGAIPSHSHYVKKLHGSMEIDSMGEETFVLETFIDEKEDPELETWLHSEGSKV